MTRHTLSRKSFVPKGAIKIIPKGVFAEIYLYQSADAVYALAFSGKRNKPDFHNRFRNSQSRDETIKRYVEGLTTRQAFKAEQQAQRKGFKHSYKVGDLLSYSWGYDQTNVEFFQVVDRTDATVTVRAIHPKASPNDAGSMSCYLSPVKDSFREQSPPLIKRVQYSENGPGYISMDYGSACLTTENEKHYCSWYA